MMQAEQIEVGKAYRTRGGWKALVIWRSTRAGGGVIVIHRPHTEDESIPVLHDFGGIALTLFAVNPAPAYGQHPADLVEAWEGGK